MKLAEFFEKHNVSFVSVTQDINTSTSSGRMMLNILMAFAEFERLVITERIRDSVAGKKRRGKYCGGGPTLGYDANSETKKLIVNKKEAKQIQEIFSLYAKLGSGIEVTKIMNGKGVTTKSWKSKKGKFHAGGKLTPKAIYRILGNPLYIGMVPHNGNVYPGEQKAIIEKSLWDKVQHLLQANTPYASGKRRNQIESPFKGLLVCGYCGGSFGITYAKKRNRRYMYYICIKDKAQAEHVCPLKSFAAGDIDKIILKQLGRLIKNPAILVKLFAELQNQEKERRKELLEQQSKLESELYKLRELMQTGGDIIVLREKFAEFSQELEAVKSEINALRDVFSTQDLASTCGSIEAIWNELFPAERYNLVHLLIDKITLFTDSIVMDIKHHGIKSLIRDLKSGQDDVKVSSGQDTIQLTIPMMVKRWNGRKIILAPGGADASEPDREEPNPIARKLAQAHRLMKMIEAGKYPTRTMLAEELGLDPSNIVKTLNLLNLSPKIQKMIVEGDLPSGMTLKRLYGEVPVEWERQEEVLLGKVAEYCSPLVCHQRRPARSIN